MTQAAPLSLAAVNALSDAAFLAAFGDIAEHSAWVAAGADAGGAGRGVSLQRERARGANGEGDERCGLVGVNAVGRIANEWLAE